MALNIDDREAYERFLKLTAEIDRRAERARQAAPGGLFEFIRYFWPIVEPARPLIEGWPLEAICEHLEAVTRGDIKRLCISIPPGFMKALDVDTPVMTTWGWKRHGDLRPGDFVFGPDGQPKRVLANTVAGLEDCYEVEFDEGSKIVAGRGHLWEVERDYPYGGRPKYDRIRKPCVVTTEQLVQTTSGQRIQRPDCIAVAAPLNLAPKRLLVDPYLMGVWLGDGASGGGTLYVGDQDIEHFKSLGRIATVMEATENRQTFYHVRVEDLATKLRVLGLLNNKHIPDDYLEASIEQRWELLRGLLDTDGTATKEGHCVISTKWQHLGEQIQQLALSLGLKACFSNKCKTLNGNIHGPYYYITFTPPTGTCVFKLARKQARMRGHLNDRSRRRYVRYLHPVGKRLVNCITVEGQLYLAGRSFITTHNSLTANVFWPAYEWGPAGLPSNRFIAASYSQSLTVRDNVRFRNIIMSPQYQALWGGLFAPSRDQFNIVKVANDQTGWKLATSVGGVGTGERGDRFVVDDGNSVKEAESEVVRESTNQWFTEVVPTRLNSATDGAIINIQQRTHDDDITGMIMRRKLGYELLRIPMEYESKYENGGVKRATSIGWTDPREEDGELAWPQRFPLHEVKDLKEIMGPYAVAGQFQQNPAPRGGGIIKQEWWQLWEAEKFPECEYRWASADTAYTEKEENDPTGFVVMGLFYERGDPKVILLNAWRKRLDLHGPLKWTEANSVHERQENVAKWQKAARNYHKQHGTPEPLVHPDREPWKTYIETGANNSDRWPNEVDYVWTLRTQDRWGLCEWLAHSCRRFKVHRLLIEGKASGLSVAQELRRLHANEGWVVQTTTPEGDKAARLVSVQGSFSAGLVYAPDREWADQVIEEICAFPRHKYKDLTDATSQALKHVRDLGLLLRPTERALMDEMAAQYKNPQKQTPLYPGVA